MPLLDNKCLVLSRKLLGVRKLPDPQAEGLAKLDQALHIEDGLTGTVANVDVDWTMLVAVKKEAVAVLLENLGHRGIIFEEPVRASALCLTSLTLARYGEAIVTRSGSKHWQE